MTKTTDTHRTWCSCWDGCFYSESQWGHWPKVGSDRWVKRSCQGSEEGLDVGLSGQVSLCHDNSRLGNKKLQRYSQEEKTTPSHSAETHHIFSHFRNWQLIRVINDGLWEIQELITKFVKSFWIKLVLLGCHKIKTFL